MAAKNPTEVITGPRTRLSYANLFEPKGFDGSKPKYSVALLIPKDDVRTIERIKSAMQAAYEKGAARLRGSGRAVPSMSEINLPLIDGDKKRSGNRAYAGCYYINAKNDDQPRVFGMDGSEVMSRNEVYSGCYARAKISFYVYNRSGNRGIACSLLGVRKVADGTPLGGSVCTAEDFADDDYAGDDFLS